MNGKIFMKFVAGDQTQSSATQSCQAASAQGEFEPSSVQRKMFFCQGDELPPAQDAAQSGETNKNKDEFIGNKNCENCDQNLKNAESAAEDYGENFGEGVGEGLGDGSGEDFAKNFADNLADNLTNNLLDKSGRGLPDYKILQQSQRPAEIAADIYNQMLILQQLYDDLEDFDTLFGEQLDDLSDELDIITRAMQRIYFNLSRTNRPPRQTFSKPRFGTFCAGLDETLPILANTLRDLRRLQRQNISDGLEIQLAIIYFTLNAHQQSMLSMQRTACAK